MNRNMVAVMLLSFILLTGCSHIYGYLDIPKYKGISKEYQDILNKWTREKTVYAEFETRVHISATLKSLEFNKAYLKEYARIYQLKDEEWKSKENRQEDINSDFVEFFFYAYIPEKEANDFDKQPSIWKIFILDENGERIEPVEIRRIKKITPTFEVFYPYINQYYGICYQLRFTPFIPDKEKHKNASSKSFKLLFTSVLGKVELEWK